MALINFDCPECGHNLEVDEGGSGFIVKCPECDNPLQVPDLPRSHRIRKAAIASCILLSILLLLGINIHLWRQAQSLREDLTGQQQVFLSLSQQTQALSMEQETEIEQLKESIEEAKMAAADALSNAALDAIDEADGLADELEAVRLRLLEASKDDRVKLLRAHMSKLVEAAKNGLPSGPIISDAGAGRGIKGQKIVFPVLPGPNGQILRENAAIMGVDEDKVSVSFPGGSATYSLSELHPGVAAYLPVDPIFVLPRKQWSPEVIRVQQTLNAQLDEHLAHLRTSIESLIPED